RQQIATAEATAHSTLAAPPAPEESTILVGREDELAQASAQLLRRDVRLLTLTGPGGSGKTRLALALGRRLRGAFDDGVVFVDLSSVRDASLVVLAIAGALDVKEAGRTAVRDLLLEYLRDRQGLLLILDNFEQVVTASPEVVQILSQCPGVKVLV